MSIVHPKLVADIANTSSGTANKCSKNVKPGKSEEWEASKEARRRSVTKMGGGRRMANNCGNEERKRSAILFPRFPSFTRFFIFLSLFFSKKKKLFVLVK